MHWVDMQWLWGYHVLPGSIRDMLHFCAQTGAKGNVNFDGVGYERLAVEDPQALGDLRQAIADGTIEVVGASYGQPYGSFHGGESNVRQRIYGVRACMRTLGVRPRTFWEEEFDFFPQLPQILSRCGYENAALFYQWTWHTPEVPYEETPVVRWESPDGSGLKAVTRNRLNVHQWPEDIQATLDNAGEWPPAKDGETPIVLQWLELMPSPDWMCRSEVLLPKTEELLADERFEFSFGTLSDYLDTAKGKPPVRRYGPDDAFHGMSLGKNGDVFRRLSRSGEATLLAAETFAAIAGTFGRPYPQWDVYPTWELEEAWRELLQAQHHDNDECEGLCGHVGRFSYERGLSLSGHVLDRTLDTLAGRIDISSESVVVFNPLGWPVNATVELPGTNVLIQVEDVPALGWRAYPLEDFSPKEGGWTLNPQGAVGALGQTWVTVDVAGRINQIRTAAWPDGVLDEAVPLLDFACVQHGETVNFLLESMEIDPHSGDLVVRFHHPEQGGIRADIRLVSEMAAVDIRLAAGSLPRPDGGMNAGVQTRFNVRGGIAKIETDSPYAVHEVQANGRYRKKYPTGDWMTSEQWFETIERPFDALTFVDLESKEGGGLLVIHDGSPQWFRDENGVRNLLTMYDPWDERYWIDRFQVCYRLVPHRGMTAADRWRAAKTFTRPPLIRIRGGGAGDLPREFSAATCDSPHAAITALYRETGEAGRGLADYAGTFDYPYVMRVVELDGIGGTTNLSISGTVERATQTNLLGESQTERETTSLELKPHEIATLIFDWKEGRKQTRDLDAKRKIWATIHR